MRLLILYGSQTGTAQDVAEQIWRESRRFGFTGPVLPMDGYLPLEQLLQEQLAIFVVATTGNGDEPDNMRQAWRLLLRRSLPSQSLSGLKFACLGLGDSSYSKFNFTAKKLSKRLQQLGATPLLPLGLCDDQHDHGLSAVALPWMSELWSTLRRQWPLLSVETAGPENVFKWHLEVLKPSKVDDDMEINLDSLRWPLSDTHFAFTLKTNRRTTADSHFQDVRLLQFELPAPASEINWRPGDIVQLRPWNSDAQVAAFFALIAEHQLDFNAETLVQLRSAYADMPLPLAYAQPVTVGALARYIWDLSSRPRQRAFELLALNCSDELEREKLLEFTTAEGLEDLINYVNRPRRSLLEVLQDFRHASAKLTLPVLFELFPIIQTRSFSIASMPASNTLDLLVAVVEYRTKLSTPRLGLCSNWLKSLPEGSTVLGALKAGTMKLPNDPLTPLIMVGPGTGIAPFRSVIQHREQLRTNGQPVGQLVVFFGCRSKTKDYHFDEDFARWQSTNFVQVFVAFSRDQEEKIYVQHLIKGNNLLLQELIRNQGAVIFVAGSSKNMPKAVRDAFTEVLDDDEDYVEQMVKMKRYQEETWS